MNPSTLRDPYDAERNFFWSQDAFSHASTRPGEFGNDIERPGSWRLALPEMSLDAPNFGRRRVGQSHVLLVELSNVGDEYSLLYGDIPARSETFSSLYQSVQFFQTGITSTYGLTFTPGDIGNWSRTAWAVLAEDGTFAVGIPEASTVILLLVMSLGAAHRRPTSRGGQSQA